MVDEHHLKDFSELVEAGISRRQQRHADGRSLMSDMDGGAEPYRPTELENDLTKWVAEQKVAFPNAFA